MTVSRAQILAGRPDAVDSYSPPRPVDLVAAGIKVASRYLSPPPNGKNVTAAEIAGLHAAGVSVLLNWESGAQRSLGGAQAGREDGAQAGAMAAELGAPAGTVIFFSSDFESSPSQWTTIGAYYIAANDALPPAYFAGAYGDGLLIDYLTDWGDILAGWQTYAWSGEYVSPNASLYQYLNGQHLGLSSVDFDRILDAPSLGAWWAPGHEPAPQPDPTGDETMLPELIRNTGTGAVVGHLGAGVMESVDVTTYQIHLDLDRPVTQLQTGPWTHYTNWLAAGNAASVAAIAKATVAAIAGDLEN